MRRSIVRWRPIRVIAVVGAMGFALAGGLSALDAGAAIGPATRLATTTVPTTVPPVTTTTVLTTTSAATDTTVAQASTDTTPTAHHSGTVAADPAQKRLRWIIVGLVGLAVIVLFVTVWFWRATRPERGVTVTELPPTPEHPTGEVDAAGWAEAADVVRAASAAPAVSAEVAQAPIMAPTAPLPSQVPPPGSPLPASPIAAPRVDRSEIPAPPLAPADLYRSHAPEPPAFEEPDPPRFVEPVAEPEPTVQVDAVAAFEQQPELPHIADDDEVEVWEPRPQTAPEERGPSWQGIRPLGPVPRGDGP